MDPEDRGDVSGRDDWARPAGEPLDPRENEEHKVFGLGISNAEGRQPSYGQGVVVSLLAAAAVLVLAIIAVGEGDSSDPPVLQRADNLF